ncbi:peptide/nickel transport system substrate-binding protein [Paenibacillus rhizosphaerae]|uniref:Peptide/nickel transport system substrate-binding protein n=1 Tax=Paenibacillus rhizosphaerae TaxID=297318 RepID=A0A839TPS5_9BACL|nr:ABC transporter substrate-binding protein [Paenibacillus rhizosphaerae]MBB3128513.1 peptide/nickel transport system substrate-binding protein [Paenibacillus rhizosphaerae]
MRDKAWIVCYLMAIFVLLTACTDSGATQPPAASGGNQEASGSGKMTDVGTPRSETLIVDILSGRSPDPDRMNPYMPGAVAMDSGLHQLIYASMWEIDTVKGEQIPDLAATMPEPLDDTNTKFRFKIQEGLAWSDGVEFTADDVQYTADMLLKTKEIGYSGYFSSLVKSMKAVDKTTIEVETVQPETRLAQKLGVVIWGTSFRVMPKHIWEKEDPTQFKFTDPVGVGPYKLSKRDPQGNWFLYEKREDWQKSDVGKLVGEPGPRYVLFKYFGPEEKRIVAAIQHDMDILQDITPESWEVLRQKNEYAKAWYENFPYADMNDPCERGMSFNASKAPYDNEDVRWALTLLTDIKNVSMATFGGMLRVSPIILPPISVLQETYHKPMKDWLKEFQLSDGYKPFEDTYAKDMVDMLKQQGIKGLPTDSAEMENTFGVGWFKYDPEEATKLLEKAGFKKEGDKWLLPDGSPWKLTINAPANFEVQSMRLAFAVADSWRKNGIDVNVQQMDAATFWDSESTGNFEVGSYWPACGLLPDSTANLQGWNKEYIVPNGQQAPGNRNRWANDRVSGLLEGLNAMEPSDPKVIADITEINKEMVKGMPFIPMFGTSKFVPVDTYYWQGFQNAENEFEGPWWWWSQFKFYTPNYKPSGN